MSYRTPVSKRGTYFRLRAIYRAMARHGATAVLVTAVHDGIHALAPTPEEGRKMWHHYCRTFNPWWWSVVIDGKFYVRLDEAIIAMTLLWEAEHAAQR